jgi:hypothetical protein
MEALFCASLSSAIRGSLAFSQNTIFKNTLNNDTENQLNNDVINTCNVKYYKSLLGNFRRQRFSKEGEAWVEFLN